MNSQSNNMFIAMAQTAWHHAGSVRPRFVLFYILFLIANITISMQPIVLAHIINAAQRGGDQALRDSLIWAAAYGGVTLLFWSFHGPARVIERRTAFVIYQNFVTSLYRKVTEMPLRWHQDHHSGSTISRVNKAGKGLFTFAQTQFMILQTATRFLTSMAVLACYSWWVAVVSLLSSSLIIVIIRHFDKTLIPLVRKNNEREHFMNAGLYDYIGNIVTVLTLRLQNNTSTEINHRFSAMQPSFWQETLLNEKKWAFLNILLILTQAGIVGVYIAIHLTAGHTLIIGSVVAIFQYLLTVNLLFFQGTLSYEQLLYQHTDLRGADQLIEDHARLVPSSTGVTPPTWRQIEISNLNFTHQEGEDVLHHLRDVDFTIQSGQKIALIGNSGSGKTTFLTLLRGLYEAQSVNVILDGQTYTNLQPLSGFTTLVPQDSEIFENTVRYNLTLGTDASENILQQALHITTFDEVAPKLPKSIDTDIRERGVNLSGGQKQRLALTRGLIAARHSSLLLLDEPTSSVDLPTEGLIFDRLFTTFADKTIIASIHRLHLLPRFDAIGLMRDGQMIEHGSFNDLLQKRGAFYELWQHHLAHNVNNEKETLANV